MEFNSLIKKVTATAFSAGLIISPFHSTLSTEAIAQELKTGDILSSLTKEQREALNQLQVNKPTGLQGFSEAELQSKKDISVIVEFKSNPGKVAVLEAAAEGKKLTIEDATAKVEKEHKTFKEDIKKYLTQKNHKSQNSSNSITQTFKKAYNGVVMTLPADQVKLLLESDVVQAVYKNQTFTVDPIADPVKQDLPTDVEREITTSVESIPYLKIDKLHKEGITGKGVKVAVLDTGIDYNHPDLKDAYKGGYDFVDNDNDPMEATYDDWQKSGKAERNPFTGATYYTEHGTHVSGTIASQNKNNSEVSVEGIAPDADLYVYRVLGPYGSGSGSAILGGIDKAVADGMDVMNLSLGANINDPYFPLSTAINYAVLSGVTAVVAAGNSGPDFYTVGSPGTAALALTVGASDVPVKAASFTGSISGDWSTQLISMGRSYADNFSTLNGQSLDLVDVGLGSTYDYEGKNVKGKIAFIQRGEFALADKIKFAKQHGAAAVIMYNNVDGQIGTNLGESGDFIPTFSITKAAGEELKEKIAQGNTAFTFTNFQDIVTEGDNLAYFSSRGPVSGTLDIKPEVVAPGVSVLSTVPSYITNPKHQEDYKYAYARHDGTSMATPHTTGIAALLLQANPKLDPDDIKTILMNTADPLNGEYSLYEMGAGRVDPYQAIHGGMKMQVTDETLIPNGEDFMKVKNPSGDIKFGIIDRDVTGSNTRLSKNISFTNYSDITKNFTVSVEENVLKNIKNSNSLSKNGVIVSTSKSIPVQANKEVKQNVFLTVPKTAKSGLYEGYIVLTNKEDPSDKYRIPFNFFIKSDDAYTLDLYSHSILPKHLDQDPERRRPNYHYLAYGNFTVLKPLKSLDVTLVDAETGKELGFVGTLQDAENLPKDVEMGLPLFWGTYNAFTGDPKQPIAKEKSYAKPGHYKLLITTVTQTGVVKKEAQDVFIDIDDPTFTSSLDGPSPFLEYKPGQQTYPVNIQITDPIVAEMQKAGINIDQSSNQVIPNWDPKQPLYPISMDKDGKWASVVKLDQTVPALRYTLDGFDNAGNLVPTKEYFFVKEGTPVTYAKSDIKKVKTGETIKGQLFLDNVNDAKEVVWNLKDPSGKATLVDAKLANGVSDKATLSVNGDEVKVVFKDSNLTFDHTAVVDVTLKVKDEIFTLGASINPTATVINSQNQTSKLLNAGYNFEVLPQFNTVSGQITPDGFRTSKYSSVLNPTEWTKAGASLKLKDSSGVTFDVTPLIGLDGNYSVGKLPLNMDQYSIDIKVPGHFEVHTKQPIGFEYKGERFGQNLYIYPYLVELKAGDVNQDNVIDVLDAIEIQKAWQTSNRASDINFDGIVDAKDIGFVKDNYLLQNKYAANPPTAKETYDGKTLDSILKELGIQ